MRPLALALLLQVLVMVKGGYLPYFYVTAMLPFAALPLLVLVLPGWWASLSSQSTVHGDAAELAATTWIEQHVPQRVVVVVDDYMWPDLKMRGWDPLWLWKVDTDPQVTREVLPHGYRSIQYVVVATQAGSTLATLPTLKAALAHSVVIRSFGGGLTARRVVDS